MPFKLNSAGNYYFTKEKLIYGTDKEFEVKLISLKFIIVKSGCL